MSISTVMTVVLDTNVLFPPVLRDTLLYAAAFRLFRPVWSAQTWDELARNLVAKGGLSADVAERRMRYMAKAFPNALVSPNPALAATLSNAPEDRHVLAAAVTSAASVIVTQNLKDFPPHSLTPYGISAEDADSFLLSLLRRDENGLLAAVRHHAARLNHPPMSPLELLAEISRHAPIFVRATRHLFETDPGERPGM